MDLRRYRFVFNRMPWAICALVVVCQNTPMVTWGQSGVDAGAVGVDAVSVDARPPPAWHRGVSPVAQKTALALFEAGNQYYDNGLLVEAADSYEQALESWKHPGIQLNLAKALILLQRQVAAYELLQQALKYGPDAFDTADFYQWGVDTLQRLDDYLVVIDVRCSQSGVQISLDDALLFESPGIVARHLLPGQHTLVAKKADHLTESVTLSLEPGARETVLFSLVAVSATTIDRRHWAVWKPWTVVGGSAGVLLASAFLRWRAGVGFDRFDRAFSSEETCRAGCRDEDVPSAIRDMKNQAVLQNRLGIAGFVLGGVGLISGVALAILNQPTSHRVDESGIFIAPSVSRDRVGVETIWRF